MKRNRSNASGRSLGLLVLCLPLALSMGCMRRHTVEPGSWRFQLRPAKPGSQSERFIMPIKDVELTVQWGAGKDKGAEAIKIQYFKPAGEEKPESKEDLEVEMPPIAMIGDIRDGKVKVRGADAHWNIEMWGKVSSPTSMGGSIFARGLHANQDKYFFDGTWIMLKTKKEK